ncbi:MAG: hydantoinase B/oxoprolinase family protein [Xanthobacteraceae bacterium]|nr:hydantoinase B/oxoprolinase family protein [Xanthobacteraceae bacterium]MBX3533439.1 hydantoinase B/oxoprolinase family protein [Xanthobacteraceae bacterium]MCW5676379.1 hydantoinase B/oxoprolinase family protein [Xanthobacteraceae bacterium]
MAPRTFDAIETEICWARLVSIVDEAAVALVRTSFSTVVRESNDFACVLLDAEGHSLAQSTISVPGFIGSMPRTLREMLKRIPKEQLKPGDVLITNDPWIGTGHLPDFNVAMPVFRNGKIVAFTCITAHMSDIGGRQWSADASEVHEEGLWVPVVKYIQAGKLNEDVHRIIEINVRNSDQVIGDIRAQLSATDVMSRKLLEFMEEIGLDDLTGLAKTIHEASRRAMAEAIKQIPEGVYHGETRADGWDEPLTIKVALEIRDGKIIADYTGTSPQCKRGINAVFNHTFAFTVYPFKSLLVPHIPNNEGLMTCFEVRAPLGCIVNAVPPAAVGARHLTGHLLPGAIYQALAKAMPDKVPAESGTPLWSIVFKAPPTEKQRGSTSVLFFNGGTGATSWGDGMSCASFPSNISVSPVEITENLAPLRFKYKRLANDSGGAGRQRGGLGQDIAIESISDAPLAVSLLTDRTKFPAVGLFGGKPGRPGFVKKNGVTISEPKSLITLDKNDVLELGLPGGGGFGSESERASELRERDAAEGYTSAK